MTQFSCGDTVWLKNGQKAEFVADTPRGIVVRLGLRYPEGDEDFEYYSNYSDSVSMVDKVFAEAPVEIVDARVQELLEKERLIREQIQTASNDAQIAERKIKEQLARLAKYPSLDMLEAMLEGRVTHFVVRPSYHTLSHIETYEEATTRIDTEYGRQKKSIRMLALVGDGDTQSWVINDWGDGSGRWRATVYPCLSYEDALKIVWNDCLFAANQLQRQPVDGRHSNVIATAKKYKIDLPEWIINAVEAAHAAEVQKKIQKIEAELAAINQETLKARLG